ncbi:hypothetical protein F5880DRAFT_1617758 [Lentinula raphanica]|nr:hypothetical protein F5880DRAFT_1617758 [Lentinula raphanica]
MTSESKRKFSDLLKQAVPAGLRNVPPEPEPETKRLRTSSPGGSFALNSHMQQVSYNGTDTFTELILTEHNGLADNRATQNDASTVPSREFSVVSERPPESTVSPDHTSAPESTVSPNHTSVGQPESDSSQAPVHPIAATEEEEEPDSVDVPNQNRKRGLAEPKCDKPSSEGSETMHPIQRDEKGKAKEIQVSRKKPKVSGWDHIRTFVRPNFVRKQRSPLPEASSSKPRLISGPYPFPFVYPSPFPNTSTTPYAPGFLGNTFTASSQYPSHHASSLASSAPVLREPSQASDFFYASDADNDMHEDENITSTSPSSAPVLTEPSQAPDFFYASDADDDMHEDENIEITSSPPFRHRQHSGLSPPAPTPSLPNQSRSEDDNSPYVAAAMAEGIHASPENNIDKPIAQPKRPPRVHIEEVIDEDCILSFHQPSAPSSKSTHAQASSATPSSYPPSASPSHTAHQSSNATPSSHSPSASPSNTSHAQASCAGPTPAASSPSNTSHAQASCAGPTPTASSPSNSAGPTPAASSPSNTSHAQASCAGPTPTASSPSNSLHAQASCATPGSHLPSAPPLNTSHSQPSNATASSHPPKRKPMPLYVDVEDDDPMITSDLTELDDDRDRDGPTNAGPPHGDDDADAIIREEIKRLISTEVRTRHMQTKFLQLLNGPSPDLTKIMCMILLHLRPVRSLDPTGVILSGALSSNEKPNEQSPDSKASLPKRKQYRRTKHRPTSKVTLQASVRAETKELLNSTLVEGNLVSVDPRIIEKWERGTHCGPTIESFYLQLEGKKETTKKGAGTWTPWNKRATEVFVAYFCSLDGFQNCKPDTVARTFRAHLLNLREKYLAQSEDPLDPQRQDQERYERRLARRNRLLKVRVEAFQGIHSEIAALEQLSEAVLLLTAEAMSGDETAGDDRFFITKVAWRSKELANFLAHLSALHLCGRYLGNGKYQRGAFPRARERSSRPESIYERDAAPKGYPSNWYDHTWLHAHPMRLASVQPGEPVPLRLPSAVMNQAKRFLSVKTRKDKPLPLNNA